MNLATIGMDEAKAKEAFQGYRDAVRERHDAEDEQIMRAYRELAKGRQLLRLSDAIKRGGTTKLEMRNRWNRSKVMTYEVPRLAVCRAHVEFVWTGGITDDGALRFQGKQEIHSNNRFDLTSLPSGTFERDEDRHSDNWNVHIRAMVPKIPPPLRPAHALKNYHILWEAKWAIHPPPPGDPALLKHIGGDLFAVLSIWDLTEVEQAVLAARTA